MKTNTLNRECKNIPLDQGYIICDLNNDKKYRYFIPRKWRWNKNNTAIILASGYLPVTKESKVYEFGRLYSLDDILHAANVSSLMFASNMDFELAIDDYNSRKEEKDFCHKEDSQVLTLSKNEDSWKDNNTACDVKEEDDKDSLRDDNSCFDINEKKRLRSNHKITRLVNDVDIQPVKQSVNVNSDSELPIKRTRHRKAKSAIKAQRFPFCESEMPIEKPRLGPKLRERDCLEIVDSSFSLKRKDNSSTGEKSNNSDALSDLYISTPGSSFIDKEEALPTCSNEIKNLDEEFSSYNSDSSESLPIIAQKMPFTVSEMQNKSFSHEALKSSSTYSTVLLG